MHQSSSPGSVPEGRVRRRRWTESRPGLTTELYNEFRYSIRLVFSCQFRIAHTCGQDCSRRRRLPPGERCGAGTGAGGRRAAERLAASANRSRLSRDRFQHVLHRQLLIDPFLDLAGEPRHPPHQVVLVDAERTRPPGSSPGHRPRPEEGGLGDTWVGPDLPDQKSVVRRGTLGAGCVLEAMRFCCDGAERP
jgi:hypothetical protein